MKTIKVVFLYILLIIIAIITTGPFLWLIFTSLKGASNIYRLDSFIDIFPYPLMFQNYIETFKQIPYLTLFFINSILVGLVGVLGSVVICALAAYPLARLDFPGKNLIFSIFISTIFLPSQANMIVNFVIIRNMGLYDTFTAIILPMLVNVFGIFLMRQAYLMVPREIEDAARIDGCNEFQIWRHVMLPLTGSSLSTLSVLSFIGLWNSFMWPLVILKHEIKYTLPVGLAYLSEMFASNFRYVAAGSVMAMLPILIFFIIMQKNFIEGVFKGSGK